MIATEIGFTTPDTITVRGRNLATEVIGTLDFVDMIMLTNVGRCPTPQEKVMVNALLVIACDHGLTPSAIAARLTFLGAPEALQGAVAAGLLGAGSVFIGPTQNAAEMLVEAASGLADDADDAAMTDAAEALIASMRVRGQRIYGLGHPIHVGGDPRVVTLRDLSRANGFYGKHWRLMESVVGVFHARGKKLPMNAVAAIAAIVADMGLDPLMSRGLMLTGRCAGLVGHILEERHAPIGQQLWDLVLDQDPRNVRPPLKTASRPS